MDDEKKDVVEVEEGTEGVAPVEGGEPVVPAEGTPVVPTEGSEEEAAA